MTGSGREREMLLIQTLDPAAHVRYSRWTDKWYVEAHIEVSNAAHVESHASVTDRLEAALSRAELAIEVAARELDVARAHRVAAERALIEHRARR